MALGSVEHIRVKLNGDVTLNGFAELPVSTGSESFRPKQRVLNSQAADADVSLAPLVYLFAPATFPCGQVHPNLIRGDTVFLTIAKPFLEPTGSKQQ